MYGPIIWTSYRVRNWMRVFILSQKIGLLHISILLQEAILYIVHCKGIAKFMNRKFFPVKFISVSYLSRYLFQINIFIVIFACVYVCVHLKIASFVCLLAKKRK